MQQLTVNLTIPVPEDTVLIKRVKLEELEQQTLSGLYWNMKDLEERVGRKHEWIKDNILYPTKFKEILDVDNGGFVYYPKKSGETWSFQANKMAEFLDDNFLKIYGR